MLKDRKVVRGAFRDLEKNEDLTFLTKSHIFVMCVIKICDCQIIMLPIAHFIK